VALVAYSPFGHDDFPRQNESGGAVLQDIAAEHDATMRQVALAFLARSDNAFVIPKAARAAHAADNAVAAGLRLSAGEIAQIDLAFPRGPKPRDLPML
jgi:diketogulonate reductase-like aldo/keto reductase